MRRALIYVVLMILWMFCLMLTDGEAEVVVSKEEIHAVVTEYVGEVLSDFEGEIEVSVRRQGDLKLKGTGAVALHVRPSQGRSSARSFPVTLEVRRGPVVIREYLMSANVRYFDQVVVASRPILRGEPVLEAVRVERREVTTRLGRYVREASELEGMRARTRIGTGRPIDTRYVERIPAVERKDRVRIQANVGGIRAVTVGVAKESGAIGDRIVVENIDSREKLLVEVLAPGVVQVVF